MKNKIIVTVVLFVVLIIAIDGKVNGYTITETYLKEDIMNMGILELVKEYPNGEDIDNVIDVLITDAYNFNGNTRVDFSKLFKKWLKDESDKPKKIQSQETISIDAEKIPEYQFTKVTKTYDPLLSEGNISKKEYYYVYSHWPYEEDDAPAPSLFIAEICYTNDKIVQLYEDRINYENFDATFNGEIYSNEISKKFQGTEKEIKQYLKDNPSSKDNFKFYNLSGTELNNDEIDEIENKKSIHEFNNIKDLKEKIKTDTKDQYKINDIFKLIDTSGNLIGTVSPNVINKIFTDKKGDMDSVKIAFPNQLEDLVKKYKNDYSQYKFIYNKGLEFIDDDLIKGIAKGTVIPIKSEEELSDAINKYGYDMQFYVKGSTSILHKRPRTLDEVIKGADAFLIHADENASAVDTDSIIQSSARIFNTLVTIGMVLSVIIGGLMGIKFIMTSAEEKAQVKEQMIPYVVGCIVVFSAYVIWKITIGILSQI